MPWDWVIDLIFKEYGSKEFYKKFKDGKKVFTTEITKEWRDTYMSAIGMVAQEDFFKKAWEWKDAYEKKFKELPYSVVLAHIISLSAPTFFEQQEKHPILTNN